MAAQARGVLRSSGFWLKRRRVCRYQAVTLPYVNAGIPTSRTGGNMSAGVRMPWRAGCGGPATWNIAPAATADGDRDFRHTPFDEKLPCRISVAADKPETHENNILYWKRPTCDPLCCLLFLGVPIPISILIALFVH